MASGSALVIDNGSGLVKAGLVEIGGDFNDAKQCVFPSVVGTPKSTFTTLHGGKTQKHYVGEDALKPSNCATLDLHYPLEHGKVQNWQHMRLLWNHVFMHPDINVDPSEVPVMLTEAPLNPKANRQQMAEIMFGENDVPALSIQLQAVLALFASGRDTGLVLDCGDGVAHTIPVWEFNVKDAAIERVNIAGHDITDHFARILLERGIDLQTDAGLEIVRDIKEKLTYVALDFDEAMAAYKADPSKVDAQYTLPNGQVITIGNERFRAPEILFSPNQYGKDSKYAIHKICAKSIEKTEIIMHSKLLDNIVLSGGTTMLPGFADRLKKEVDAEAQKLFEAGDEARVIDLPERKYMVWRGGAIMASLSTFRDKWITKQEYEEDPDIIFRGK